MEEKKLRIWNVTVKSVNDDDTGCCPVGATTRGKAIVAFLKEVPRNTYGYMCFTAKLARDWRGKAMYTDKKGILDLEEIMNDGYEPWWKCMECGEEHAFAFVPHDNFYCWGCTAINGIPYPKFWIREEGE